MHFVNLYGTNDKKETQDDDVTRRLRHQHNARVRVKDTGLLYDAIQLAQHKKWFSWAWQPRHAEHHPALLLLCDFWEYYQGHDSYHEACIPYIQCFIDRAYYEPLIATSPMLPVAIDDKRLHHTLKTASVMFGEAFLVTYLAGRHITVRESSPREWVCYTVNNQPLLHTPHAVSQEAPYNKDSELALGQPYALAWHTLQALHDFPQHFPRLWQQLKKHEGQSYDIH